MKFVMRLEFFSIHSNIQCDNNVKIRVFSVLQCCAIALHIQCDNNVKIRVFSVLQYCAILLQIQCDNNVKIRVFSLREMQRLSSNQVEKSPLLENMFFSRPPTFVRQQVKRANLSLNKKADLADELIADEISGNQNHTFAIAQPTNKSESFSEEEIYAIRQMVQKKNFNKKHWNENNTKTNDPQNENLCWYHHTFGSKATNCQHPCSFSKNGRGSQ